MKFGIQFLLFAVVLGYYIYMGFPIAVKWTALLTPLLLVVMALISLGFGMIISSMTTEIPRLDFCGFFRYFAVYVYYAGGGANFHSSKRIAALRIG